MARYGKPGKGGKGGKSFGKGGPSKGFSKGGFGKGGKGKSGSPGMSGKGTAAAPGWMNQASFGAWGGNGYSQAGTHTPSRAGPRARTDNGQLSRSARTHHHVTSSLRRVDVVIMSSFVIMSTSSARIIWA